MSKSTPRDRSIKQEGQRKTKKKHYVSPKFLEYGALAELTKMGNSAGAVDGGGTMQMMIIG